MAKLIIVLFLHCFLLQLAQANDSTIQLTLEKNIIGNYKNFELDNLGNIYVVTPTNQIKKIDSNFDSIAIFNSSKILGNIASIDVSNPLKILVFFKNFSTIVVLDRFLTIINTIELQKQNLFGIGAITTSYDNNIWLFDDVENKIKKIDSEGKTLLQSIDFRLLFTIENAFNTDYLKDIEGKLYLYNKQNGLLIFDYYGGLQHRLPLLGLTNVQVQNNLLIGLSKTGFEYQDIKKHISKTVATRLNYESIIKCRVQNILLYTLSKEGLSIYKMNY